MKKFKLNAVLVSILMTIACSGSAFAISSDSESANTPVYMEMSEDNNNLTEEITEEEPEVANVSTLKKCPGLYGFAFYLHVHYEDRIKQILDTTFIRVNTYRTQRFFGVRFSFERRIRCCIIFGRLS